MFPLILTVLNRDDIGGTISLIKDCSYNGGTSQRITILWKHTIVE